MPRPDPQTEDPPGAGRGGPRESAGIERYAILGNRHSAALVGRDGSIDWWCPFRFDNPSLFGGLLDPVRGGRFAVRPTGRYETRRSYEPDTNVLVTAFRTAGGELKLRDALTVSGAGPSRSELELHHGLLREVECVDGTVELEVVFEPRWDYGRARPRLHDRGGLGLYSEHRGDALTLRSDVRLEIREGGEDARGVEGLEGGERRSFALTLARQEPLVIPPLGAPITRALDRTADWWRAWARERGYEGPYRDAVMRSALALKLLTFAPSGAIVAAPTTSLPEEIGGERNWDYRFCWLRDATMAVRVLLELGDLEEARSFLLWLLHATHLTRPELRVAYDVYGRRPPREREIESLSGYEASGPVRVGNAAADQLQLDVYGEVVGAARAFVERGGSLEPAQARRLGELGDAVCQRWREPDNGIWEVRSDRRHHTLSKAQCWLALTDLLALHERGIVDVPADRFEREREEIRAMIETRGYDEKSESYVSWFGGRPVDASLLLMGLRGYVAPDAPRMRTTARRILDELDAGGLLRRYDDAYGDGVSGGEATFAVCSFWAAEYLVRAGETARGRRRFEHALSFANDVGLFGEEIDPDTGALLGNFPQAFTHLGLISAAMALGDGGGSG